MPEEFSDPDGYDPFFLESDFLLSIPVLGSHKADAVRPDSAFENKHYSLNNITFSVILNDSNNCCGGGDVLAS